MMHHVGERGGGSLGSGRGWQPPACRVSLGCWHCGATAFPIPRSWQRCFRIMDAENANFIPVCAPTATSRIPGEGSCCLNLLHLNQIACMRPALGLPASWGPAGAPVWLEQRGQPHPASNLARGVGSRPAGRRGGVWGVRLRSAPGTISLSVGGSGCISYGLEVEAYGC